jgi:hypothetical protein
MKGKRAFGIVTVLLLAIGLCSAPAFAQLSGAIFTTDNTGTQVNGNIYSLNTDVYLDGGPQGNAKCSAAGLPNGNYYFQVTDPSGAVPLSSDDVSNRLVTVSGGLITAYGGTHKVGLGKCGNISVALAPFNPTPNNGGEYKVWMAPADGFTGFTPSNSKTDNFKVRNSTSAAYVTVCKFNDVSDNGSQDSGEPLIPHWPITATGVDAGGTPGQTVITQTDDFGCVSFAVSSFPNSGTQTVTLTEGTLGVDWTQTAPGNGTYDAFGIVGTGPTTVSGATSLSGGPPSGGVISVTLSAGDNVTAPNFGNFNPNCGATDCGGTSLVVTKDANPSNKFTWTIQKSVDQTTIDTSTGSATFNYTVTLTHDAGTGWVVNGNIRVSNPTLADISGITVTDAVDNGGSCTITDTNVGLNETVEAGEHIDVPYTCTYNGLPMPIPGTNTATATWATGTASGPAIVDFTNAVIDGSVSVSDTFGGTLGTVSYTDPSPKTFTYSKTFTGDLAGTCTSHDNTATFTTNTTGTTGTASQAVKQCVGADLLVSKTAAGSFNSNIAKSVSPSGTVKQDGGSVTFTYKVTVTESGWSVSGNITVINPNNWEDITANLADALNLGGAACTISGGSSQTVPASSRISPSYTCAFSSAPSATSGTNTAMATWDNVAFHTPDASASGTFGFSFGSLTITDTFNGGTPNTLGTVNGNVATTTFATYTHVISVPTFGCHSYTNTATITGTNQTSSQTVTVCGPVKTGALTMGFWANKNGQGIISGGASGAFTSGVCNSASYLLTYNPFQDLGSTATCKQVASYVYTIIKSANAGGASMNAMLKAQMLATALDVFFSDPSLGGNVIGAPAPLGGVAIDLTKVCSVSDQSGGVGTCSGSYINVSSAFGNATSGTVSFLLWFAASQSNSGGNFWYANIKSIQFLAKDTFDAINNQLAFAP